MKNLYSLIAKQLEEASQKEYEDALIAATEKKKLTGKAPKIADPVHVKGIGVMSKAQADKYYPGMNYTVVEAVTAYGEMPEIKSEPVELSEAKWETTKAEPATNLKRGDNVYVKLNNHTIRGGKYLQSQDGNGKPGHPNGHLIKWHTTKPDEMTDLNWHKPEHVFHDKEPGDIEKVWDRNKKVAEEVINESEDLPVTVHKSPYEGADDEHRYTTMFNASPKSAQGFAKHVISKGGKAKLGRRGSDYYVYHSIYASKEDWRKSQ